MSKSLRSLEREVGISLIRRSPRGVVCTPAGQAFFARARTIRTELRKAQEELAALTAPGTGSISAGFSLTCGTVAARPISRFLDDNPLVRLRIVEGSPSTLVPLVRDETLDFAVMQKTSASVGAGLNFRALYRDQMVIACRRGHGLRGATSLRELADERWLGFNAPGSGSWIEQAFAAAELPFPKRFTLCESFSFAFEILTNTDAVTAVPPPIFGGPLNRGFVAAVPVEDQFPLFILGLCTRADAQMQPLTNALARAISAAVRSLRRST